MVFQLYHIWLFASIQLLSISILRGDKSFKKQKFRDIVNSMGLGWVTNEDQFLRKSWPKIADKFTILSKTCFSIECFTAEFLRFLSVYAKSCFSSCRLGTCHQIETFQGYSWFPNCLTLLVLSCSAYYEATHTLTIWW